MAKKAIDLGSAMGDDTPSASTKGSKRPGGRQVTTMLDADDFKRLRTFCVQQDAKQFAVVEQAILEFLERQKA